MKLIKDADFIKVIELTKEEKKDIKKLVKDTGIDYGEAEAIKLFQRGNFDLIILADRWAEKKMNELGVSVIDLIDVGIKAAQEGLINLKEFAKKLSDAGYHTERIERILTSP